MSGMDPRDELFDSILQNVAENMCFETGAELKEDGSILYTAEPDGESLSPEQIESILTSDNPRETLYKILDEASLGNDDFLWDAADEAIDNLSEEDIDFLNEYILETYSDEVSKLSVFRDIHPFDFEFDVAPFFLLEAQKKERAEENSRSSIQLPQDATFGRYDFTGYSAPGFYIDNLPKPIVLPLKDITLHNDGAKVSPRFAYAIGEDYSAGAWDAKATLVKDMPKKEKSKTQNAPCR